MRTAVLPPTPDNIALAAQSLRAGDVVAMPTETVYGLAGVVFDEAALAKIFGVKERPKFDPLICHVPADPANGDDWLARLEAWQLVDVAALSPVARDSAQRMMSKLWPGPVTLILPKQAAVPDLATGGLPTLGIRSPRHPVAQALLQAVGQPLAAPSANRFGRISPTTAAHVLAELGDRILYILDGGPCDIGIESTVLLIEPEGRVWQLRPGGLSPEQIANATGVQVQSRPLDSNSTATPLPAPGLLASHYAPRKPLQLLAHPLITMRPQELQSLLVSLPTGTRLGLLVSSGEAAQSAALLQRQAELSGREVSVVARSLSVSGDLTESAQALFGLLRDLDENAVVDRIWAEHVLDDGGLGYAINDRLTRASHSE